MIASANSQSPQYWYNPMESATAQGNVSFLQDLGSELVFTQDASGQYLSFYWQNAERYDLSLEKVVKVPLKETFHPVALDCYQAQIQRVLERRTPERGVYSFCYADQHFPVELVISPILPREGNATTVLVMGYLLPQALASTVMEPILPPLADPYKNLQTQISRSIRRTLDLDTIWQRTVTSLGEALAVSRCIICSYKPEQQTINVEAEYCQKPFSSMLGQRLKLALEPHLRQAIDSEEPVVVEQITPTTFEEQSVLVVSTSYKDKPNGLISLQQCDRRRHWTVAEIELVRELADQVGTAIAHGTLYKELEAARAQAEEASRLKSQFLANTTHELRTPLNGIICSLKLIIDGLVDSPEEQSEFIDDAHRSALHLLDIINDILDIAKIEAGKMELDLSPVQLNELMHAVEKFTNNQAQEKKLSLNIELPPTHDNVILFGNYQRLLQVLLNLVGNAIKFTHEGGVTVSTEIVKKKVTLKNHKLPGVVKVRVADTGIGVSLDKQDKLFQSFSQVDGERTRQYGGTGLGLTISQKLVESMGGVVNFYSMGEGLGSTVTFTIPLYQEPVMISSQTSESEGIELLNLGME
ncbi:MAG: GAF domain-containing protein [Kastovskya adunca ATA6-11-RM4]|jgi:signal transduction histidine kinase|nr:GAF domain-containing protein [Kastovskya adunca ATA6-11-RM4]